MLPGQFPAEKFATLAHEVAHEMMHRDGRWNSTMKRVPETEAEAVAFVVCSAIGLETGAQPRTTSACMAATRSYSARASNTSSERQLKFSTLSARMNHPRRPAKTGFSVWLVEVETGNQMAAGRTHIAKLRIPLERTEMNLEPFSSAASRKEELTFPQENQPWFVSDELAVSQDAVSSALVTVFRGKFCEAILPNRKATSFERNEVLYEMGGRDRTFFFLQDGFVKVGAITPGGRELIYDIRSSRDVVGELCVSEARRPDRAVALEHTEAVAVLRDEIMEILRQQPDLFSRLVDVLGRALVEAYEQVNTLATDNTLERVAKTLLRLAAKIGKRSGSVVEIEKYLTQEELAQMVAARRERVSTALNFLRRHGAVHYLPHGHLSLNLKILERHAS